jgi:hypothetical protein
MYIRSVFALSIVSASLSGCNGSGYTSAAGPISSKAKASQVSEDANPVKPVNQIPSSASPSGNVACSQEKSLSLDVSVQRHQDRDADMTGRYGEGMPTSDVDESAVVRLELNKIKGDLLPVKSFDLDDIAILVKESDVLTSTSSWSPQSRERSIRIPQHAVMIYDGNNPNYASGSVDSGATTHYKFGSKVVTLAGGESHSLKDVYGMGVPLVAHNKVTISDLKARGFVDGSNRLVFKVFHVSHGWGNVNLRFELSPCP